MVKKILENKESFKEDFKPIEEACLGGNEKIIKALLDAVASVLTDKENNTEISKLQVQNT